MFLPIGDETPRERTPYVNSSLIAINAVVWFFIGLSPNYDDIVKEWGLTPINRTWTHYLTSMFLHADIWHLGGNMLYLWIFGDNVEDKMGHGLYLAFYLVCGWFAALFHSVFVAPAGFDMPLIGASGAISGVLGAYFVFFPRQIVKIVPIIPFRVFYVRAGIVLGFYFFMQVLSMLGAGLSAVAYGAHVGGAALGAVIGGLYRYLLIPARFGDYAAGAGWLPGDLRAASRPSAPASWRPLAEKPAGSPPVARTDPDRSGTRLFRAAAPSAGAPTDRWAVLLVADPDADFGRYVRAVRAVTSESAGDVVRRIAATRGVLARDLPRPDADQIRASLNRHQIRAVLVPESEAADVPRPRVAAAADPVETGVRFLIDDGLPVEVPWNAFALVVGAEVRQTSSGTAPAYLDFFGADPPRIRVVRGRTKFSPASGSESADALAGFRRLADACVRRHGAVPLNPGVRVFASGGGSLGYLRFDDEPDFNAYVWRLLELLRPGVAR